MKKSRAVGFLVIFAAIGTVIIVLGAALESNMGPRILGDRSSGVATQTGSIAGTEARFCLSPFGSPRINTFSYWTFNESTLGPASNACASHIHLGETLVITNSTTSAVDSILVVNSNYTNNSPSAGDWTALVTFAPVAGTLIPFGAEMREIYWASNNSSSVSCVAQCSAPPGGSPGSGSSPCTPSTWFVWTIWPFFQQHFNECATQKILAAMTWWFLVAAAVASLGVGGPASVVAAAFLALGAGTVYLIDSWGNFNGVYVAGMYTHACFLWWCWGGWSYSYLWHN